LALRSLLVEIYPPQLDGAGLGAALQDLVAPAQEAGVDVRLDVADTDSLSNQTTALVWRTAQECVRNALRHGSPSKLDISVQVGGGAPTALLRVVDNGRGFEISRDVPVDSFGLRGLRDLAREAGGTLTVESSPGKGTAVTLAVPTQ
jgi:signal transduction histidine kinase